MAANSLQLKTALQKPYDRVLFAKDVLSPVFGTGFSLYTNIVPAPTQPNNSEKKVVDTVSIYGNIVLEDSTEVTCYEIVLQPQVRIEQSKVAIQRYVRKLLTAGQAALVNFVTPLNKNVWRLTLVAKDSVLTDEGIKENTTHAKRYTYILGKNETCKTPAERFEKLSTEREINFQALVDAFSVEKLSKAFFDEYTLHYEEFINHLNSSNFKKSVFNGDEKAIRDFTKKLLGRIVFLYFVQKKGWLGATTTKYIDGKPDFINTLFHQAGGDEAFYSQWLTILFFDTLNKQRTDDDFEMPDGNAVKVPFLNGGLFDKEAHDNYLLTFSPKLFHNTDFTDTPLDKKAHNNHRGFLDFLDAFNFTVHEDSPDEHTIAVDPEMLGHIFENLLEDNKDKGAFYTPKEIVHYMCQESLTEYLATHLSKEYTVYKELGNAQVEFFGNDTKSGQLKMIEEMGDKALNRDDVASIVKTKDISRLTTEQLGRIDQLLNTVKICDPAIGSGAFPMGLLQEIFSIKEAIAYELETEWKPAVVKEKIIQNSIYGVDIEKGAVDIARLRFWLSLVVDEEKPRALPNLDYKIVVGDSIVSKFNDEVVEIDWERKWAVGKANDLVQNMQRLLKEIAAKQKSFFEPTTKNKTKLRTEIRNLKLELLINQLTYNKQYFAANHTERGGFAPSPKDIKHNAELKQTLQNFDTLINQLQDLLKDKDKPFEHFDWRLDFPEILNPNLINDKDKIGFDIVIGNPPYISYYGNSGSFLSPETKKQIVKSYESVAKENDRINSMNLLSEKGLKLLKSNGNIAYIVNKTASVLPSYSLFREFMINNSKFNYTITNLTPFQAIVDCFIFSTTNAVVNDDYNFKYFNGGLTTYKIEYISSFKKNKKKEFHITENETILDKIELAPKQLSEILTINRGVNIGGCFDVFLSPIKLNDNYKEYLSGTKCIKPYYWDWLQDDGYMLFDTNKEQQLRKEGKTIALGNHDRYLQPKIIIPESSQTIMAAYIDETIYSAYGLLVGTPNHNIEDLKYSCGLLNSKLITFYCIQREILRKGNKATPHVGVKGLNEIPIYVDEFSKKGITSFVTYILFLKFQKLETPSEQLIPVYFEQIIDGMVYELYFPELLKQHNREIIKHLGELPDFTDKMSDAEKMAICKQVFNRLNEREHPVRVNLFYMDSIHEIRIIEGKDNPN